MFEISYTTARLARVVADDRETAKRRFAAYVLYDDATQIDGDVELSFGDEAVLAPDLGPAPAGGTRDEVRAWLALRESESESFEPGLFEDGERALDAYLRILATNDPWRLEGHGNLGRTLSAVPVVAEVTTFDGRIRYRFEATQFVDYLRADVVFALDPGRPQDSLRIPHLLDVSAQRDENLRQITSSYDTILRELSLTARLAREAAPGETCSVTFDPETWRAYVAHRRAEPERFLPPAGWTPAYAP